MKVCFSFRLVFSAYVCILWFCATDYADRHAEWYVQDLHGFFNIYKNLRTRQIAKRPVISAAARLEFYSISRHAS